MKYLFIIMLMTLCGCHSVSKDDLIMSRTDLHLVDVNFSQIEDKYTLSIVTYKDIHKNDGGVVYSDFEVITVPPIHVLQGESFEWSNLDEGGKNGVVVHGTANTDVNDVRINCTFSLWGNGQAKGFQDQSFKLNSVKRIPLYPPQLVGNAAKDML